MIALPVGMALGWSPWQAAFLFMMANFVPAVLLSMGFHRLERWPRARLWLERLRRPWLRRALDRWACPGWRC